MELVYHNAGAPVRIRAGFHLTFTLAFALVASLETEEGGHVEDVNGVVDAGLEVGKKVEGSLVDLDHGLA
jgi:hypothetical protein